MEPKMVRHLHNKATALRVPINGSFELTARCNFSCPMCYVHLSPEEQQRRGRELTGDEWLAIAEQARNAGTVFLLLTGGEPLLHPEFKRIYLQLKKMGFLISINTNGSMIEGDMLDLFRQEPPYRFNITLYSTSNEGYVRQCGVPIYDRVVRNIRSLREDGMTIRINLTITPENQAELPELVKTARELGTVVQGGTYLFPPVRVDETMVGKNLRPTPEEAGRLQVEYDKLRMDTEAFLERAERIAKQDYSRSYTAEEYELGTEMLCRAGRAVYWIDWQGNMMPCAQLPIPAVNVLKNGFDGAWKRIVEEIPEIRLPKECVTCKLQKLCNPCAAKCYAETGAFHSKPEYVCRFTNSFYDTLIKAWKEEQENGA